SYTVDSPFETVTRKEDGTETRSKTQLARLLDILKLKGLSEVPTAGELMEALRTYFKIDPEMTGRDARAVIGILYELTLRSQDVARTTYVFTRDVDINFITVVKERKLSGVKVETVTVRQYNTKYAAHLLGQVGAIQNWDNYKDKGYSLSDTVGISGAESAFEELLKGSSGTKLVELSQSGRVVNESWAVDEETGEILAPQPGHNIMLTIDIGLQEIVEEALARHIPGMTAESEKGACVVMDMTGGVLASATYPSYTPAEYRSNYGALASDPLQPLFNRALQGLYAPGSTFKPMVAAAGLTEGVITTKEKIQDTGRYLHYDRIQDQPMCWIYRDTRGTHGFENVSEAIRDSCNIYFFETGLRLGIATINDYAGAFGLGKKTGLELYEETGQIAGPETSAKYGQTWYEGETMYASIGQGSTQVTPIQLANYVSTLVNGGNHYTAHLLKTVKSNDFTQVLEEYEPQVQNQIELSGEYLNAIKQGMRMAATTGTMGQHFANSPVAVGAKTGSAQVTGQATANAVLIVFAPYDNPEIAIATVVEKGGSGSRVAAIAADIVEYYFSNRDAMNAPNPENTLIP
ncbi:MAG: penicillin-binding protein, partial [Oscillospiraceae bacterium]|nr:penicillin-binding protein [Oscillospiraceae bacterium]